MTNTINETDEFVKLLEESYNYKFSVADVVKGIVVKQENEGFLVDIGAKTEAFLPNREISNVQGADFSEILKIGEVKEFYVLREETNDEDSKILLSLRKLSCAKAWQNLQNAKMANETVQAKVASLVRGGVIVEVMDLRGFIPASQLRTGSPFDGLVGQTIDAKILEADAKRNKLILSQRQAIAEQREQVVDEIISNLEVDSVVKGEVVRIADFGAFIDINGVDGLLPISEISWQRIKHPSDILSLGQELEVKILKIDNELKRISLSLKRMGDNPWEEIENKFEEGQIISGTVNKLTSFGAFINIFPGVEALLPSSEMEPANANPFDIYNVGDEVEVLIKKFTPQEHRIALSVRDLKNNAE
ncbi:MAG: S1 RNA-binding domain-containing protein [Candidatus Gastranaerophilales bacterium]|nr:S1 RNA-binding domain-containing protein [Candidatus Gastranaerophilales bacterium]